MRYLKQIFCLLIACAFVAAAMPAHIASAEEITGSEGWSVTFDGNQLVSNMGSIADAVNQMQPGDSVTFTVSLKNAYTADTDFWMYNAVLKSFEDNSPANGGAYEYRLSYNGEDIFNSDTVGGEDITGGREGLKEATGSLEDYFFLGTLEPNATGTVTLEISLDGETQGNNYQSTLANVDMRFAAELTATPQTPPGVPVRPAKTGDETNVLPLLAVFLVSGIVLLCAAFLLLRRENKKGGAKHA